MAYFQARNNTKFFAFFYVKLRVWFFLSGDVQDSNESLINRKNTGAFAMDETSLYDKQGPNQGWESCRINVN